MRKLKIEENVIDPKDKPVLKTLSSTYLKGFYDADLRRSSLESQNSPKILASSTQRSNHFNFFKTAHFTSRGFEALSKENFSHR